GRGLEGEKGDFQAGQGQEVVGSVQRLWGNGPPRLSFTNRRVAMRMVLGVALLAVIGLTARGPGKKAEKNDGKKLGGKWNPKEGEKGGKFFIEFTKDGKMNITVDAEKEIKIEGTYKLDGNKLKMNMKFMDMEKSMTRTISKLTDTELVSKDDESGKEDTLMRVKERRWGRPEGGGCLAARPRSRPGGLPCVQFWEWFCWR